MKRPHTYEVRQEVKGRIIGVRKIQDRGRVQIPREVRDRLGIEDGDSVYWVESPDGKIYIVRAVEIR